jgi:hypothetical protein
MMMNDIHNVGWLWMVRLQPSFRYAYREPSRSAQGVTLIRCGDEDLVTSATLLAADEDEVEE